MSKEQLVFDTTDAVTIEQSDKVGAVAIGVDAVGDHQLIAAISVDVQRLAVDSTLRDGDGTALTSTLVGGDQALDVNVVSGINVEVDLDYLDDSVTAHQGGTWVIDSITNPVAITDNGQSITVDASDLDIRTLSHDVEGDSVKIGDGVEIMQVNADGSINVIDDDLDAASDSVSSHTYDGAGAAITSTAVGMSNGLDVNILNEIQVEDAALANIAIASAALTLAVADTAQDVVASPLADRKYLHIMNMDNKRVYIGPSGVTSASGYPLSPKAAIMLRAGSAVDIEFVGSAGATPEVRTLELS